MRAPNEASEPQRDEVKPTGMLGPASSNGWTMSPVRRWKRLMSPHGVFQRAEVGRELVGRGGQRLAAAAAASRCVAM